LDYRRGRHFNRRGRRQFSNRQKIWFLRGGFEPGEAPAERQCHFLVNRAGMRFLFFYAILRKHVEDDIGFHLKLTGQLVDTNLTHRESINGEPCRFSATYRHFS
jgi:hypothetical protein